MRIHDINFYSKFKNNVILRTHFEQEKFNLQREENEGYSKLVIQLN